MPSTSPHTYASMMLEQLEALLAVVRPDASETIYRMAIVEDNVLEIQAIPKRHQCASHLSALHGLDPRQPLFGVLRALWDVDHSARPTLALLSALSRDPLLMATRELVIGLGEGQRLDRAQMVAAVRSCSESPLSAKRLDAVARNAINSWIESGHITSEQNMQRQLINPKPAALALAMWIGYANGDRGKALLATPWSSVLDASDSELLELAKEAKRLGLFKLFYADHPHPLWHQGWTSMGGPQPNHEGSRLQTDNLQHWLHFLCSDAVTHASCGLIRPLTPGEGCAFLGCMMVETGDPQLANLDVVEIGSGDGRGAMQYTGCRRSAYERARLQALRDGCDPNSNSWQQRYFAQEYSGLHDPPEGSLIGWTRIFENRPAGMDPAEAVAYWTGSAEKAEGYFRPGIPHLERRVAAAECVWQLLQAGKLTLPKEKRHRVIYLHWAAKPYTWVRHGLYHTIVAGDGHVHRLHPYNLEMPTHTHGRGKNSVGLCCACMGGDPDPWSMPPTAVQIEALCREAADLGRAWGWSPAEITISRVMTHAEAASNRDGRMMHDNYGPMIWGGTGERWDFLQLRPDAPPTGGDELRARIRALMENQKRQ